MKYKIKVWKTLSKNDTGETGSHQSGISIVKNIARAGIFPILTTETKNPETTVVFKDENDIKWEFHYKYYNDAFFGKEKGKGHDEYRLTCVKDYLRYYSIKSGDQIWFGLSENGERLIGFERQSDSQQDQDDGTIHIRGGWRIINI